MHYFRTEIDSLNIYQRQIYYWNVLFDKRNNIQVLDNVNFSLDVYPEVLKVSEVIDLHTIEPGYSSPDASYELGEIIRRFEFERLMQHRPERRYLNEKFSRLAGVGCNHRRRRDGEGDLGAGGESAATRVRRVDELSRLVA